jgi:hypothetical protein
MAWATLRASSQETDKIKKYRYSQGVQQRSGGVINLQQHRYGSGRITSPCMEQYGTDSKVGNPRCLLVVLTKLGTLSLISTPVLK